MSGPYGIVALPGGIVSRPGYRAVSTPQGLTAALQGHCAMEERVVGLRGEFDLHVVVREQDPIERLHGALQVSQQHTQRHLDIRDTHAIQRIRHDGRALLLGTQIEGIVPRIHCVQQRV